jgi:cephalosporin hydroxylase
MIRKERNPADTIEKTYQYHGWGNYRKIQSIHAKNAELLVDEVNRLEPSVIVEIGVGYGGSFYL